MTETSQLTHDEIEAILEKIEAHASKIDFTRGFKIGQLHTVYNSRITFAQSYINSLKGQILTSDQQARLEALKRKLYIPLIKLRRVARK